MTARIHLVRHGVCAHEHDGSWVNVAAGQRFMELYDAAGIRDEPPAAEAIAAAATSDIFVASTLRRAIESVRRLAPDRNVELTPLLCETGFDGPALLPIRLPVDTWDGIDYVRDSLSIGVRHPTPYLTRAREATDWLLARAAPSSTLLAVTHGRFRRFLWAALIDRGWRAELTRKTYHNWSVWTFREP
jgi:hypothetical protein